MPGVMGIDTRLLTKKIREKGAMLARIEIDGAPAPSTSFYDPNKDNLVAKVSRAETCVFGAGGDVRILALDCGCKANIIRSLVVRGAEVTLVPFDHPLEALMEEHDGLFLSNGPGDPTMAAKTIDNLRAVLDKFSKGAAAKPIFGICLGNQLLSLAAGARTKKLKFGNRGQNQPVRNSLTGDCYITSQNHGYAVDASTLPSGWKELFQNLNDGTNEGVYHESLPYFTAQFHPEAMCGPTDTTFLFDTFLGICRERRGGGRSGPVPFPSRARHSESPPADIKKVLLLGSGGLSIGQAGEFDYSGSQAIKALKEEGIEVVLMNPNIASVQTNADQKSEFKADHVFFLPVTPEFVEQVLKREKPDGVVISMGGQTALNCAVKLHHQGIFRKYGVRVLGTPVQAIIATEDRDIFNEKLREIGEKIAPSEACCEVEAALQAAERIGYPVMVRAAYALGGLGSGICADKQRLKELASKALTLSPQILVEKSLWGWKEVEYEVVRDRADNCITVCNMENFDPLGVHTGDSIVVAPSQTLNNVEYHMLRETALKVVRHLGIVGECNIQYALDPYSKNYCIIEVNARLSRSSALASKATGYPLAFVAAKLALGATLPEIKNSITKSTVAFFEPSLDYCVTKVPRWDLSKFERVSTQIGSAMKSVGEVMAIGRTWEESMHKAIRMVDPTAAAGFEPQRKAPLSSEEMEAELSKPTDLRVFAIAQALYSGSLSVDQIHSLSKIDHWFLYRLKNIAEFSKTIAACGSLERFAASPGTMLQAKRLGFTDSQIAARLGCGPGGELDVRRTRIAAGIRPFVKQIDTLSAEFPAETNYLYMTYSGAESDVSGKGAEKGGVIVLGSGTYRIGSSVEFDWCGVSAVRSICHAKKRSIMINYNPETVSTDYDESDLLFFEELSRERVMDVYDQEAPEGVVVSVGGQIPNNLALPLEEAGAVILGTSPSDIDRAEDRHKFSALMDSIGVEQAPWEELTSVEAALTFAEKVSYPVLIRPSYVLSGAAMNVAHDAEQLTHFLGVAADVSQEHPVVVSKFISGAREVEMDAVAHNGEVVAAATHIHVENAGVHSGDATLLLPPGRDQLSSYSFHRVQLATQAIAKALNITGPFNIQFICKDAGCMVIECNCRASRSFPFVSKAMGVDFIEVATRTMLGLSVSGMNAPKLWETGRPSGYVACKVRSLHVLALPFPPPTHPGETDPLPHHSSGPYVQLHSTHWRGSHPWCRDGKHGRGRMLRSG